MREREGRIVGHKQLTRRRWAALMIAAKHGHNEMVQLLADLGADVNKAENEGRTGA